MARMSSATSTKKADPTVDRFGDRDPTARPVVGVEQGCFPAGFTMALARASIIEAPGRLLVVKPESPRELSSALTGRLEIITATTIRHSQPAELDLEEQGGRFSPRGPTRPLPLWTSPQLSPRPAVVASVTVVSGFRAAFPAPGNVAAKRCASEKRAF